MHEKNSFLAGINDTHLLFMFVTAKPESDYIHVQVNKCVPVLSVPSSNRTFVQVDLANDFAIAIAVNN